jgi:MoxR-like ATPase
MSLQDDINSDFDSLLTEYPGGISNTSTVKYEGICARLSKATGIPRDEMYATGTTSKRTSNLDTRFPQGNQRNQHAELGIAFVAIKKGDGSGTRTERIAHYRAKALNTVRKFVTGEERGTTFNAILLLMHFEAERELVPAALISRPGWKYKNTLLSRLPVDPAGTEELAVVAGATPTPPASTPGAAAASGAGATAAPMNPALVTDFERDVVDAGLRVPAGLIARAFAALLSKRFVIFQGLSGSGKSRLAQAIAYWFQEVEEQVVVVAVGADWTSSEHVVGYQDALAPERYRRPASGALNVILDARSDSMRPYFLILDEMNLSHVERYFADMLSAIESDEAVSLHASEDPIEGVPSEVKLPPNLFILGTVNVDETTYAFSPKVLDRANVIEFRVTEADLAAFLDRPRRSDLKTLRGNGRGHAEAFVRAAASDPSVVSLAPPVADGAAISTQLKEGLLELFRGLAPHGWEFGFRVALEIQRFVYWHAILTGPGWEFSSALDAQVVQKVMPKLRGSEYRLRPALDVLEAFAKNFALPMSADKARRLADKLRDGFAAFSEV